MTSRRSGRPLQPGVYCVPMRSLPLLAGVSSLLVVSTCFAASGAVVTGSGSGSGASSSSESAMLIQERLDRTKDFHVKYLQSKKDETALRAKQAAYETKRAAYRQQCRDDLRRANRDARFPALLRCYKGDLALEADYLGKLRDSLKTMAGVTSGVRINAQNRLDLLKDAMDTVTLGIDGGVYATNDDLLEVRRNLLEKYRKPWWSALDEVRADQTLSWTQYLITLVDALRSDEKAAGTVRADWDAPRACLVTQEAALHAMLLAEEQSQVPAALTDATARLQTCLTLLDGVPPGPAAVSSSSQSSSSSAKPRYPTVKS
jgi:hypothetical protein